MGPGVVDVYGIKGRRHAWVAPGGDPKHLSHEVVQHQKAKVGGRESVYYLLTRKPYGNAEVPPEIARALQAVPAETIVEVSGAGVRAITLNGLPAKIAQIVGVGLLNRPGQGRRGQLDALVVCTRLAGQEGVHLSMHDLRGELQGAVRKIYEDLADELRLRFVFVPESDMLVAIGVSRDGPHPPRARERLCRCLQHPPAQLDVCYIDGLPVRVKRVAE